MSKGYLIFAQNSNVDYLKQVVALSASLKRSGNLEPLSVVTNDPVPEDYLKYFDTVIPIPWGDSSKGSQWKVENRWKLYHCSPYEQTIVFDSDVLVTDSLKNAWAFLNNYDLYFTSTVYDFKSRLVTRDIVNRKTFIDNDLPNVYFGFHYFRKSEIAKEFYTQLENVVKHYKEYYRVYTPNATQDFISMDVSSAISLKILGLDTEVMCKIVEPAKFIHMKSDIQSLGIKSAVWMNVLDTEYDGKLYIGNHVQRGIFHYVENDFLTADLFQRLTS
jgi:hypothetical protein